MDVYHKILIVVAIALFIAGGFIAYQWLQAHDAQIRAEAESKADAAATDKISQQQKEFTEQLVQLRKDTADAIANNNKQFAQAQSPQQLAALIGQIMGLKQAPIVVTPAATPQNPNPVPVIQLPDTPQAKIYFQECETCKLNLASAVKAAAISDANFKAETDKLKVMTDDRDSWRDTANGGTWTTRAKKAIKWIAFGAIAGAAALCGSGHCN